MRCQHCGLAWSGDPARDRVGVRDVCQRCGGALHCCRNCAFYERGVANDCREPMAERVVEKEAGNFCDWFRPAADGPAASGRDAARARLDALFAPKKSDRDPG